MNFGEIYPVSWWGDTNAANGWGIIYPFNAEGTIFSVDTNLETSDTTQYKADATQY